MYISKYISNVPKIYKINIKYQAAAVPARPKPGPSPGPRNLGPARARPRVWAGLEPSRLPLGILYLSCVSWIYLDIDLGISW